VYIKEQDEKTITGLKRVSMEKQISFQNYAIVACGTLNMELNRLRDSGRLDVRKILYTKPGRHEVPLELEGQLIKQIGNAKKYAPNIIVVYGGKFCYINADDPYRKIDTIWMSIPLVSHPVAFDRLLGLLSDVVKTTGKPG
jgi:hypothetical protein